MYVQAMLVPDLAGIYLVAEWMHFTLSGIILPTIKLKVHFLGLMNSATKFRVDGFIRTSDWEFKTSASEYAGVPGHSNTSISTSNKASGLKV